MNFEKRSTWTTGHRSCEIETVECNHDLNAAFFCEQDSTAQRWLYDLVKPTRSS